MIALTSLVVNHHIIYALFDLNEDVLDRWPSCLRHLNTQSHLGIIFEVPEIEFFIYFFLKNVSVPTVTIVKEKMGLKHRSAAANLSQHCIGGARIGFWQELQLNQILIKPRLCPSEKVACQAIIVKRSYNALSTCKIISLKIFKDK